ncbi:hypothetical protein KVR01_000967 [Diaporthe batatas]|uniref:uncharacterized protein n=1 Tax=Diaporthe batatas TaxID=748121 RepID=UPI001D03823B|nr:uncharacterized protein KVR01_000967 [Diaporthe batatas]KAG8170222.1 hypothetical protein KVR01_000967 [Diaporthe batatas]
MGIKSDTMAPDLTITIQTFSDTVCPWSYIGKKNLDKAIDIYKQAHPEVNFEVTWNPFYLNPEAKVSGYKKKDYYAVMFGPARAAAWFDRVNDRAKSMGLSLNWDGLCGNTRDSHILLLLAQKQQQQQKQQQEEREGDQDGGGGGGKDDSDTTLRDTLDALFDGVFVGGRDVSDRGFLAEVAIGAGLCGGPGELLAVLDDPRARAEADALDRAAKRVARITAAPSYVVQGRYSVGGQQDSEVFLVLFDRIRLEGGKDAQ